MKPKVSVIVPVYNVLGYLEKCVTSLVSQTLEDIEILLINDGSTDGSGELAEKLAADHLGKVKVFHKANGGLSDARNFGIDRAAGEFLAFVDSDDWVLPGMLERLVDLAEKYEADLAICNIQKVDEGGQILQKLPQLTNFPEVFTLQDWPDAFADLSYFACNKLFHRRLFEGFRFKKEMHFEDIELIPKILLNTRKIVQTQEYFYQYLERAHSISKSHTLRGLDLLRAVQSVTDYFPESSLKNHPDALKNFQILQGFYSFLAYLAFVKNQDDYYKMGKHLRQFLSKEGISIIDILSYRRFGRNYILSLPGQKKAFYALYLAGFHRLLRRLVKN